MNQEFAGPTPPKPPRPAPVPLATSPTIARLERELREYGSDTVRGRELVEQFWRGPGNRSPLVEPLWNRPDERLVTFCWQDAEAERVLLFVNRITDERNLATSYLRRVADTDIWHRTYRMGTDWRASYSFLPQHGLRPVWLDSDDQVAIRAALDRGMSDPRNPETSRNRLGTVLSVVSLPDAPSQPWVARREATPRGAVIERDAPDGRRVWVYTPPAAPSVVPVSHAGPAPRIVPAEPGAVGRTGYSRGREAPVVLMLDGEVWTSRQDLPTTMDNLIADGLIQPSYAIMLDSGGREARWRELAGGGEIGHYLVRRLLPWARRAYPLGIRREDVLVAGVSLGGLAALRTALEHSLGVGGVISLSASLWRDDLSGLLAATDVRGLRVHLEVGSQEWVLAGPNRELAARLAQAGAEVRFVEYNGGHDYACWRGGIADGLRHLLAPSSSASALADRSLKAR